MRAAKEVRMPKIGWPFASAVSFSFAEVVFRRPLTSATMDGGGSDVDALLGALTRWSGDERLRQRAAERSRQRWLHQQALESSTLRGVLVELAENAAEVSVRTAQRVRHGRLVAVGTDLCVLEDQRSHATIISLDALVAVEAGPVTVTGRRPPELALGFADALAALAAELLPVRLEVAGGDVAGDLIGTGEDVVILRSPAPTRHQVYVGLDQIGACALSDRPKDLDEKEGDGGCAPQRGVSYQCSGAIPHPPCPSLSLFR